MIDKILKGFGCDPELRARVEALGTSDSIFDQAAAIGYLALKWRPVTEHDQLMVRAGEDPAARAKRWASELSTDKVENIELLRSVVSDGLQKDLVAILGDETQRNGVEKDHIQLVQDQLVATGFILEAVRLAKFAATG